MNDLYTYIIAEAGVNHNGSEKLAYELIDIASEAGADAIKFQTFSAESLVHEMAKKADYQIKTKKDIETQYQMLKRLELNHKEFSRIFKYCKKRKIEFMSTAFDIKSLNFLTNKLKVKKLKIASGDITDSPLLFAHAKTKKNIFLSTGMSDVDDIEKALKVLSLGFIDFPKRKISKEIHKDILNSIEIKKILKEKVTLLHCVSQYPAPFNEINLKSLEYLRKKFKLSIGYSDHSRGISVPIAAVALGATVIEKHFTINKNLSGPDHKASLNPKELKVLVKSIREVEKAKGVLKKNIMPCEISNRKVVRKSLFASKKILKGEIFSEKNISIKRPGGGISPNRYWEMIGKKSKYDFLSGDYIKHDD